MPLTNGKFQRIILDFRLINLLTGGFLPKNMNQHTPEFTRRNFIKKTALTSGSIAILSQGVSLADDGEISSIFKCRKYCDGNPTPVPGGFGVGGGAWGVYTPLTPPNAPSQYFPLYTCKCSNGHSMGTTRGPSQAAAPPAGTTIKSQTSLPPEHTNGTGGANNHGPCGA